jgi:hypothetical protein
VDGVCSTSSASARSNDDTDPAATQLRTVIDALITAGHLREGDPEIWIIVDSGYDGPRADHEMDPGDRRAVAHAFAGEQNDR